MRKIGVVTVGRSDFGSYLPVLRAIQKESEMKLLLLAGGMHLSPRYGSTLQEIAQEGFSIQERVEIPYDSDTSEGIAASMGQAVLAFSHALGHTELDLLVVFGDRFEMHAAALAALPFRIPVAHIHGGEITEGAFDNALRHSITKLSHLHFVAAKPYAQRVQQMGEETWRILVSGAPALDHIDITPRLSKEALSSELGMSLEILPLLVTFHPATLETEDMEFRVQELLKALERADRPIVFTAPNADTGNRVIATHITDFVKSHHHSRLISSLGNKLYFSLMANAAAMVGNSSSGIIEAPSLGLPVVNVGNRQSGRLRAANVIDVGYSSYEILVGISKAVSQEFRASLVGLSNPYGDGHAASRIVKRLKDVPLDKRLLVKRFVDQTERDYASARA